jgi:high-affinity nickel-transport protein
VLNLTSTLVLGFLLGLRHATDADHVIAVTTMVGRERHLLPATRVGALWGLGHAGAILLAGGLVIATGTTVPPALARWLELGVGLMLLSLGGIAIVTALRPVRRTYVPLAGPGRAPTFHRREPVSPSARPHRHLFAGLQHGHGYADYGHRALSWREKLRPLLVGLVHGLAGTAAVSLLVLGTIDTAWHAIAYLCVFGIGTIGGMMLATVAIALPFALSAGRAPMINRGLQFVAGSASVVFGILLIRSLVAGA